MQFAATKYLAKSINHLGNFFGKMQAFLTMGIVDGSLLLQLKVAFITEELCNGSIRTSVQNEERG
jgi:hypothetical protein